MALLRTLFAVLLAHLYLGFMLKGLLPWMGADGGVESAADW